MSSIPGIESLPVAVQFAVLFVVIFAILALIILVLRRLTGGRVGMQGAERERTRTRQPRLGIVDVYDLDRQRQLVLLRRDNVEHLLLIGGPNDVVIETNIVRSSVNRPSPGVESGDRPEFERPPEAPPARPILESSWGGPSSPVAQIGPVEVAATMPPAAPAQMPASRGNGQGNAPGGLQKSLSQFMRRPESAPARAAEESSSERPAAAPPTVANPPRPAPATTAMATKPPPPAPRANPPPPPASAGEGKLPFGMRAPPRPKAPEGAAPAPDVRASLQAPPRESSPASGPPRENARPTPPQAAREPAPVMQPPEGAPPGDFSGELRAAEPSLVDTALLSDMAKQLETALRRPASTSAQENGYDSGEDQDPAPASPPPVSPPRQSPTQPVADRARPGSPPAWPQPQAAAPRPPGMAPSPRAPTPPSRIVGSGPSAQPPREEQNLDFDQPAFGKGPRPAPPEADEGTAQERPEPPAGQHERTFMEYEPEPDIASDADEEAEHRFEPAASVPARQPPPPAEPAPASKSSQVDPFSMEDIEAEFARLLGRPLDKR